MTSWTRKRSESDEPDSSETVLPKRARPDDSSPSEDKGPPRCQTWLRSKIGEKDRQCSVRPQFNGTHCAKHGNTATLNSVACDLCGGNHRDTPLGVAQHRGTAKHRRAEMGGVNETAVPVSEVVPSRRSASPVCGETDHKPSATQDFPSAESAKREADLTEDRLFGMLDKWFDKVSSKLMSEKSVSSTAVPTVTDVADVPAAESAAPVVPISPTPAVLSVKPEGNVRPNEALKQSLVSNAHDVSEYPQIPTRSWSMFLEKE